MRFFEIAIFLNEKTWMAAMDIPPLVPFNIEVESAHGPVLVGIQVFELLPSATATPLLPTRRGNLGSAL